MAIKCLMRKILNSDPRMTYKFELANAPLTHVRYNEKGWHVIHFNDVGHLPAYTA